MSSGAADLAAAAGPAETAPGSPSTPVTVVFTRLVRPGAEADFEAVLKRIVTAAEQFPGQVGATVLRPAPGGSPVFTVVAFFASAPELQAWLDSDIRARLMAESDAYCTEDLHTQEMTGLEGWFRLPGATLVVPPSRVKMALLSWIGLLPLLLPLTLYVSPQLSAIPLVLRLVVSALVMTFAMTYVVMPRLTRLARPWLYHSED